MHFWALYLYGREKEWEREFYLSDRGKVTHTESPLLLMTPAYCAGGRLLSVGTRGL